MKKLLVGGLFLLCARPAWAQDMDAMLKWTEAKVVHYRVVGEFSGKAPVFLGGKNKPSDVTDRVEIEFDWNQEEYRLVGSPVIRNFASKAGPILPDLDCPASKVGTGFEFATIVALKDQPQNMRLPGHGLILESRRDHPAGEGPLLPASSAQSCGAQWEKVAASSVQASGKFDVPLAMLLAMGPAGGAKVTPDGKSIVEEFDPGSPFAGWKWTYTPTVVK